MRFTGKVVRDARIGVYIDIGAEKARGKEKLWRTWYHKDSRCWLHVWNRMRCCLETWFPKWRAQRQLFRVRFFLEDAKQDNTFFCCVIKPACGAGGIDIWYMIIMINDICSCLPLTTRLEMILNHPCTLMQNPFNILWNIFPQSLHNWRYCSTKAVAWSFPQSLCCEGKSYEAGDEIPGLKIFEARLLHLWSWVDSTLWPLPNEGSSWHNGTRAKNQARKNRLFGNCHVPRVAVSLTARVTLGALPSSYDVGDKAEGPWGIEVKAFESSALGRPMLRTKMIYLYLRYMIQIHVYIYHVCYVYIWVRVAHVSL